MSELFGSYAVERQAPQGRLAYHTSDTQKARPLLIRVYRRERVGMTEGASSLSRKAAIARQRAIWERRPKRVAPVYKPDGSDDPRISAAGHDDRGIWYVTAYQKITLAAAIENYTYGDAEIRRLVGELFAGLAEIKRLSPDGGTFGSGPDYPLKPGNCWFSGPPKELRLVLDEVGPACENLAVMEAEDLRAVAGIIYQLVHGSELELDPSQLPLDPNREGEMLSHQSRRQLQPHAAREWFELCNQLCGIGEPLTLEQLRRRYPAAPAPWTGWGVKVVSAAVLLALVAVVVARWFLPSAPKPRPQGEVTNGVYGGEQVITQEALAKQGAAEIQVTATAPRAPVKLLEGKEEEIVIAGTRSPPGAMRFEVIGGTAKPFLGSTAGPLREGGEARLKFSGPPHAITNFSFDYVVIGGTVTSAPATVRLQVIASGEWPAISNLVSQVGLQSGEATNVEFQVVAPRPGGTARVLVQDIPGFLRARAGLAQGSNWVLNLTAENVDQTRTNRLTVRVQDPWHTNQGSVLVYVKPRPPAAVEITNLTAGVVQLGPGDCSNVLVQVTPATAQIRDLETFIRWTKTKLEAGQVQIQLEAPTNAKPTNVVLALCAVFEGQEKSTDLRVRITNRPPALRFPRLLADQEVVLAGGGRTNLALAVEDELPNQVRITAHPVQGSEVLQAQTPAGTGAARTCLVSASTNAGPCEVELQLVADDLANTPCTNTVRVKIRAPVTLLPNTDLSLSLRGSTQSMVFKWVEGLPGGGSCPGRAGVGGFVGRDVVLQRELAAVLQEVKMERVEGAKRLWDYGRTNSVWDRPADGIDWYCASKFCEALTLAGQSQLPPGWRFTLPNLEQWRHFAIKTLADGPHNRFGLINLTNRNQWTVEPAKPQTNQYCLVGTFRGGDKSMNGGFPGNETNRGNSTVGNPSMRVILIPRR